MPGCGDEGGFGERDRLGRSRRMALAAAIECFRTEAQDVISFGFRESGFQTVLARASRPCVGCTIRTGGTPVPLPWKRRGRRNFVCLSTDACELLNMYAAEICERYARAIPLH